jgi:opacity protein-like surface antigen
VLWCASINVKKENIEMKKLAIATALVLASIGAQAQGMYAGLGYSKFALEGGGVSLKPSLATLKLGYEMSPYLAVEGRIGAGGTSDTLKINGVSVDMNLESFYAVYAKGTLPLGEMFGVYGLVGYNSVKGKASAGGYSVTTDSQSGGSYGAGVEINFTKSMSLSAEWARNFSDTTNLNFGVTYKF